MREISSPYSSPLCPEVLIQNRVHFTASEHNLSQDTLDFGSIRPEQRVVFNNKRSGSSSRLCLNFVCSCTNAVPPDKGGGGESFSSSCCTGVGFRSEPTAAGAAAAAMREQRAGAAGPVLSLCVEAPAVPCRAPACSPRPGAAQTLPGPRGAGVPQRPEGGAAGAAAYLGPGPRPAGRPAPWPGDAWPAGRRVLSLSSPPSRLPPLLPGLSPPPWPIFPSPLVFHLLPFLLLFFRFLPTLPTCSLFPPSGPLRNSPPLFLFFFPFPSYMPSPLGWQSISWGCAVCRLGSPSKHAQPAQRTWICADSNWDAPLSMHRKLFCEQVRELVMGQGQHPPLSWRCLKFCRL